MGELKKKCVSVMVTFGLFSMFLGPGVGAEIAKKIPDAILPTFFGIFLGVFVFATIMFYSLEEK